MVGILCLSSIIQQQQSNHTSNINIIDSNQKTPPHLFNPSAFLTRPSRQKYHTANGNDEHNKSSSINTFINQHRSKPLSPTPASPSLTRRLCQAHPDPIFPINSKHIQRSPPLRTPSSNSSTSCRSLGTLHKAICTRHEVLRSSLSALLWLAFCGYVCY